MTTKISGTGSKGLVFEETLKNYFLQSGFYVLRGVPFSAEGLDLSDIDLWLYERPTGSARRRAIVDAKTKVRPKAAERLVWTHGLKAILRVDEAYVATTDARAELRSIARTLDLHLLDGNDVRRIQGSSKVVMPNRLTNEELNAKIANSDRSNRDKVFSIGLQALKASVVNLGSGSAVQAIGHFQRFAATAVTSHPNSATAEIALRLAYLSASVVALSLDYIGAGAAFRSSEERRQIFTNAIRFGTSDGSSSIPQLNIAIDLVRRNIPNGIAVATQLEDHLKERFGSIPAEIISEFVTKTGPGDGMFNIARALESAASSKDLLGFDLLEDLTKGFVAVLLDYCDVERAGFARSFVGGTQASVSHSAFLADNRQMPLIMDEFAPLLAGKKSARRKSRKK